MTFPRRPGGPRPLLTSWELHLRAERISRQTIKSYGDGVRRLLTWCRDNDRPRRWTG